MDYLQPRDSLEKKNYWLENNKKQTVAKNTLCDMKDIEAKYF